jgi:hypothetical protein
MTNLWLDTFLGVIGRYIIIFIDKYYYFLVPPILVYGIFVTLASFNLKRIEKGAAKEIIRQSKEILKEKPNINYADLTTLIQIDWVKIREKYSFWPFIAQESGLGVNRSSLANIRNRIMQNERKIHLTLERHGIVLLFEERRLVRRNLYLDSFQHISKK